MTLPLTHEQAVALDRQLIHSEGLRLKPYRDTLGHLTIGIGHLLSKGISRRAAELIYEDDLAEAVGVLHRLCPWAIGLAAKDPLRYRVLVELAFNLGGKLAEFKKFLAASETHDWHAAARELQDSTWFTQVASRGPRLVAMLLTDHDPYR